MPKKPKYKEHDDKWRADGCPKCEADWTDIDQGMFESEHDMITNLCNLCGCKWYELYHYAGIEIVK